MPSPLGAKTQRGPAPPRTRRADRPAKPIPISRSVLQPVNPHLSFDLRLLPGIQVVDDIRDEAERIRSFIGFRQVREVGKHGFNWA